MASSSHDYQGDHTSKMGHDLSHLRISDRSNAPQVSYLLPGINRLLPAAEREMVAYFPMRLQWECTRAALHHDCSVLEMLPNDLEDENYDTIWDQISSYGETSFLHQKTSPEAWNAAGDRFDGVELSCRATFDGDGNGPQYKLSLQPLHTHQGQKTSRFQSAFGSDRFLTIEIPTPINKQTGREDHRLLIRKRFDNWLLSFLLEEQVFLDRVWRAFFLLPKKSSGPDGERYYEVKLFAIRGAHPEERGSIVDNLSQIRTITLQELLNWFIPLEKNQMQLNCKLYDRIRLGFSKSCLTLAFCASQVYNRDDIYGDDTPEDTRFNDHRLDWGPFLKDCATSRVMTDGCARISECAANEIWKLQGEVGPAPSVLQGRFWNAKGLWIKSVDPELDYAGSIWIETVASQRKFDTHPADRHPATADALRMTFGLVNWSAPPTSSKLSISLLPILENRGVSKDTITECVLNQFNREEKGFVEALSDPGSLISWIAQKLPATENTDGSEKMQGSQPVARSGRIKRLLLAGFRPTSCYYLASLLLKGIEEWLDRITKKLDIPIASSTFVLGVPDMKGVLKPGEVHLSFSRGSPDDQRPCLYDLDVLVGRYPMHRRSDVQKVRAVYCPELAYIQDAIVFATRGCYPLAEKMSNGDYDGDDYWVCWDELLVKDFRNAPPPGPVLPSKLNIKVDRMLLSESLKHGGIDHFLQKNFKSQLESNVLGSCTSYQERYTYQLKTISSPELDCLADLRDLLVDAPKNGCQFTVDMLIPFLREHGYPTDQQYPKLPAYKTGVNVASGSQVMQIVDFIRFRVASPAADALLSVVKGNLESVTRSDSDLESLYENQYENACCSGDNRVKMALHSLIDVLDSLFLEWKTVNRESEQYDDSIERAYAKYKAISTTNHIHPVIRGWSKRRMKYGFTTWELLKASALYAFFIHRNPHFVFTMASRELLHIKALQVGPGAITVTAEIMERMKVKKRKEVG